MKTIAKGLRGGVTTFGIILFLNLIGFPLTAGPSVLWIFAVLVGILAALFLRSDEDEKQGLVVKLLNGLIIGLIAGLGLAVVTYLFAQLQANAIRVNLVFAQVLPEHTGALTGLTKPEVLDGVSVIPGLVRLVIMLTVGGGVGTALSQLPLGQINKSWQSESAEGTRSLVSMALPFLLFAMYLVLRIKSVQIAGSQENIVGLVILYLFFGSILFALRQLPPGRQKMVFAVAVIALVLAVPLLNDLFQNAVLGIVAIFIIMGIGLNIVVGFAGLLDLGYVAFFAVGAYTFGLLSAPSSWVLVNVPGFEGLTFWAGLPTAILMGAFAGIMLGVPVLRMRGDYLAIVTLGFGEIIRLVILNLRDYTGGPGGVLDIPPPFIMGHSLGNPRDILYLAMAVAVVVTILAVRLRDSRLGRAWIAMREDEDVAQAMGINLVATKLLAFAFGAVFGAVSGAIYASRQVNIFPDNFALDVSINVLSLIIIGGIGSIEGVVLGAIALIGLPEILRSVNEYRIIAFGALLVAMMILRPEGLLPSTRRKRELHVTQDSVKEG